MKVYIVTDFGLPKRLEVLKSRCLSSGFEVEVVGNVQGLDIDKDVIISTNEGYQYDIFEKYLPLKANVYVLLNDKIKFYYFLKENRDLLQGIRLIPTYGKSYKGPNITKTFLVKNKDGWASEFNQIIHGNIYELIQQYSHKHQVQEIIDVKHIYGISCSCLFGKILGIYSYKSFGPITPESYVTGFDAIRTNHVDIPAVRVFLKKIFKRLKYNGIVEMEFIIDHHDIIYIMECNPRISGSLMIPHYFDWVIMPYLNCLHQRKIVELNMDDKSLWCKI